MEKYNLNLTLQKKTYKDHLRSQIFVGLGWFPLSLSGILLVVGFYISYTYYGGVEKDYFLTVVGFAGLCIASIAIIFSTNIAIFLWWKLKKLDMLEGTLLLEGHPRRSPFKLPIFWWVPFIDIRWELNNFGIFCDGNEEVLTPNRRGEWDVLDRRFVVRDIFGFTSITFVIPQKCELQVLPDQGRFNKPLSVNSLLSGSDISHPLGKPIGDRMDIRNYTHGDPVRYILWKTYARTGQLVVRTPERALQPSPKMISYLVVGDGDCPAAGIMWALVESKMLGKEWEVAADGFSSGVTEIDDAKNIIIASANSEVTQAKGLQTYMKNTKNNSSSGSQSLLLFVPPIDNGWVQNIIELQLATSATIIICVDGIERRSFIKNTFFSRQISNSPTNYTSEKSRDAHNTTTSKNIHQISTRLTSAGMTVLIADRRLGTVLNYDTFRNVFENDKIRLSKDAFQFRSQNRNTV